MTDMDLMIPRTGDIEIIRAALLNSHTEGN